MFSGTLCVGLAKNRNRQDWQAPASVTPSRASALLLQKHIVHDKPSLLGYFVSWVIFCVNSAASEIAGVMA